MYVFKPFTDALAFWAHELRCIGVCGRFAPWPCSRRLTCGRGTCGGKRKFPWKECVAVGAQYPSRICETFADAPSALTQHPGANLPRARFSGSCLLCRAQHGSRALALGTACGRRLSDPLPPARQLSRWQRTRGRVAVCRGVAGLLAWESLTSSREGFAIRK